MQYTDRGLILYLSVVLSSVNHVKSVTTSKSIGDDLAISMNTEPRFINNGSRLEVTCKMKCENGKPANLQFLDDGLFEELKSTDRLKITIDDKCDDNGNFTIGKIIWDPIFVTDKVKTIRCYNVDKKNGKTFKVAVIPSFQIPQLKILNGSTIELNRKVQQHKLLCQVNCSSCVGRGISKGIQAQWRKDLYKTDLPSGLSQEFKEVDPTTGFSILTIKDVSALNGERLICVSKLNLTGDFEVVRVFKDEIKITVVGESIAVTEEIKTKDGMDARLDCNATGSVSPNVTWYKKDEYLGTSVLLPVDLSFFDERYSFEESKVDKDKISASNSVISIKDITYKDRSQFVCKAESAGQVKKITFTLRVADPFGALWPVLGIIAEALVMVIIIWYTDFNQKREERKKKKGGPSKDGQVTKDSDDAPLM